MIAASLTEYLADAAAELPPQIEVEDVIATTIALHERNGGVTLEEVPDPPPETERLTELRRRTWE